MSRKIIPITGVSGYFRQLPLLLLEDDSKLELVIGVDRHPPPSADNWNKLSFHQLDIQNPRLADGLTNADALFHHPFVLSNEKLKAAGWSPKFTTPEAFQVLLTAFGE